MWCQSQRTKLKVSHVSATGNRRVICMVTSCCEPFSALTHSLPAIYRMDPVNFIITRFWFKQPHRATVQGLPPAGTAQSRQLILQVCGLKEAIGNIQGENTFSGDFFFYFLVSYCFDSCLKNPLSRHHTKNIVQMATMVTCFDFLIQTWMELCLRDKVQNIRNTLCFMEFWNVNWSRLSALESY